MSHAGVRTIMERDAEWLEADGRGGFASGTVGGVRMRRYHALLLAATRPPGGRVVLVNGLDVWMETPSGTYPLSTQLYLPDVVFPDGAAHLAGFAHVPWPRWDFVLPDGTAIGQELFVARDTAETVLRWTCAAWTCAAWTGTAGLDKEGVGPWRLHVRPLLSGRDYHALHRENPVCALGSTVREGCVVWRPYAALPAIVAAGNGAYQPEPVWYRNFLYRAEQARGLDDVEDLASPGRFTFAPMDGVAVLILRAEGGQDATGPAAAQEGAAERAEGLARAERARRAGAADPHGVAAASYVVGRGGGRTILAGFPWFTDWGRDSFVAMRGLLLATGRLEEADALLCLWAGLVDGGMLPNRFTDAGDVAEFNAVDASLWFVVAVGDFLDAAAAAGHAPRDAAVLAAAVEAILDGYLRGTRHGIGCDADGLVRAGVPGSQLTWMDARIGDRPVTPRIGKPVEIQALWINALFIAGRWSTRWAPVERAARAAFAARFPDPASGGLFDVVDADHRPGATDGCVRPNQILAVGGLPCPVVEGDLARGVVALVERVLLTPLGLRSLAPDDPQYRPHYRGDPAARDAAYHQGTVWPWLMGPFVEAWLRVRGAGPAAQAEARARFLAPLQAHLETAGLGHVSEVADGDPPHVPGGCPFQAWSLGELIRIERMLADARNP
ncbi:amylo-alpha-1,6-glucosidase [Nguyenibacter sp. L1]|uniref:amylo-alpha-1,6-glucosidase n=1 Tax=Nguyenibacter sp. L1 TaxID=3049350 RepID=UPI002B4A93B0|nr:amylo-alpha-1,6-glucosidase [Nguyenibacter sp. L1]WRH87024.1 amylo-alpha-1,6-glucosidase [Nguyenibacter sp. L1]